MGRLVSVVGEVLGCDPATLQEEAPLREMDNWDSLRHMSLVLAVERTWNLRLTPAEIARMRSVAEIRSVLTSRTLDE
jgi:acyl carrier protein